MLIALWQKSLDAINFYRLSRLPHTMIPSPMNPIGAMMISMLRKRFLKFYAIIVNSQSTKYPRTTCRPLQS